VIAYVHIEKNAGTSLKFILRNSFGIAHCDIQPTQKDRIFYNEDFKLLKNIYPWAKSISGHSLKQPSLRLNAELDYYTFLREPVERSASHYQYHQEVMKDRKSEFEQWIQTDTWRNFQVRRIAGEENLQKAIDIVEKDYFFVGLVEKFDESLAVLKALCPYPLDTRYHLKNAAIKNEIKDRLLTDNRKREMLEEANQIDGQFLTYVKKELYPKLKQAAVNAAGPLQLETGRTFFPWKYRLNQVYYKSVYRPAVKFHKEK